MSYNGRDALDVNPKEEPSHFLIYMMKFHVSVALSRSESEKNEQLTLLTLWQWTQVIIKFTLTFFMGNIFFSLPFLLSSVLRIWWIDWVLPCTMFSQRVQKMRLFNITHKFLRSRLRCCRKKCLEFFREKGKLWEKPSDSQNEMEENYMQFIYINCEMGCT